MQARELAKKLKKKQAPYILDVRSKGEYRSGHIPGARHIPFWAVLLRLPSLPDRRRPIVLTCERGPRAQAAQSQLRLIGYRHLDLLEGHMSKWRQAKLPLE